MGKMKRIIIDFDNTAYNTTQAITKLYNDDFMYYSDHTYIDWRNVHTWGFDELELAKDGVINAYFNQPRFFRTIKPMANFEVVAWLLRKDYKLTFCSHGYSPNLRQKQIFIAHNYPNDEFIGVNLKEYKDKSCVDMSDCIFIDDTAANLETSNAAIKILFGPDTLWNSEWDGIRCKTWNDVYAKIRQLEETGEI